MSSFSIFSQKSSPFGPYKSEPLLSVTVEWLTQILEAPRKGKENRTAKLTEPRFSLEGSDFILTDDSYDALSQAFIDNDGQGSGFFFKCPLDYYVTATPEYYHTGVYQQGILHNLTGNTYQICKKYSVAGVNSYKTILGVISDTLQVYKDNVLVTTGYTFNPQLGTVTFSGAQTGVLTVSCQYELKFRFDVSDLQLKQIKRAIAEYGGDRNVYQSINFRLVEDDYSKVSPLETSDWTSLISYDFGDYKLPNTTYSERVLSRIEKGDNLKESREILTPVRRQFKYEQCNRNWKDLQRVYTLFNVAKGQLLPFQFEGINVRWDADSFSCEQLGINAWSINEMGSIETLFDVEDEVKNWAYFVEIGLLCTPKSLTFTDPLSSEWDLFQVTNLNGGTVAEAGLDIVSGGVGGGNCWQVSLTFGGVPSGGVLAIWKSPYVYVPTHPGEVITFTYSESQKPVSGAQAWWICVIENGIYKIKYGGTTSISGDWVSVTATATSAELGLSIVPGVPIYFGIFRSNENDPNTSIEQTTIALIDNWRLDVDVTCP